MKKSIVFLLLILSCQCGFCAQNPTLDKIENSLYGYTYSNENETSRLKRIEENVYGHCRSGQTSARIAKLKKDLSVDMMGKEITPTEDTFRDNDDYIVYDKEPPEAATMDYPVINELEKKTFNKDFKGQNIKTRLSNLEKKIFNKIYEKDDLSTRVDRLKAKIQPSSFMANGMDQQNNDFYKNPPKKMAQDYHLSQYGAPFDYDAYNSSHTFSDNYDDLYSGNGGNFFDSAPKPLNLSKIEKKLYRTKYENEPTSTRLGRIEKSIFGTSFDSDSDSERMDRLSSAIQAQKSASKYDSNRFSQNMATAVQIGTLILMVLACIL